MDMEERKIAVVVSLRPCTTGMGGGSKICRIGSHSNYCANNGNIRVLLQ